MTREPVSTPELWRATQTGDKAAFGLLYDHLAPLIYGLCLGMSSDAVAAQDATRQTFVQMWQQAPRLPAVYDDMRTLVCSMARRNSLTLA